MGKLGYTFLSPDAQRLYDAFDRAISSGVFTVPSVGAGLTMSPHNVLCTYLGDNPHVLTVDKSRLATLGTSLLGAIHLQPLFSKSEAEKASAQLEAAVQEALAEIEPYCGSGAYNRLRLIHEYIQSSCTYDRSTAGSSSGNPLSHIAYGALVNKTAVCDGIASAVSLLANRLGVECAVISGMATLPGNASDEHHAWNIVKLGDKHYHLDTTWDLNFYETLQQYSYEYFCVDDRNFTANHKWDKKNVPACNSMDMSYYVRNAMYATSAEKIEEILTAQLSGKKKTVRVRVSRDVILQDDSTEYFREVLLSAMRRAHKSGTFTYSWNSCSRCFTATLG